MKVYLNQTNLTITLATGTLLTNVSESLIMYVKPDGTSGQWSATVDGLNLVYSVVSGDLNQSGVWTIWAKVTLTNTKVSIGEGSKLTVYKQGE